MADVNAPTNDGLVLTVQLPESRDEVDIRHFGFAVDFQRALAHQGAEKAAVDVESAIQDGPRVVKFDELETAAAGEAARTVAVLPDAPENWHLVSALGLEGEHRVLHRKELTEEAFQAAAAEYESSGVRAGRHGGVCRRLSVRRVPKEKHAVDRASVARSSGSRSAIRGGRHDLRALDLPVAVALDLDGRVRPLEHR